jgi:DNA repair protein RadC
MKPSHSRPQQLAIPLGIDAKWASLADEEVQRNPTKAESELRAATLLGKIMGLPLNEAETVLRKAGGVFKLAQLPEHALRTLPYIGPVQAKQLRAMTDWALLLNSIQEWQTVQVRSPADVANLVMLEMGLLDHEELRVMALDTKNFIVDVATIYQGSVNAASVRIAELLRLPITLQCSGMIMIHNHPSGDPSPSPEDVSVTAKVRECATAMDIDLVDHLIIGTNRYVSLKERGLGFGK